MKELPSAKGKGTAGKVFQWLIIVSMAGGLINQYINPDWLVDAATEDVIHNDVDALKDTIKAELLREFKEKIDKSDKEHAICNAKLVKLQKQINDLNKKVESIDKHTNFNTQALSIHSDILWEELDEAIDNNCNFPYRESNTKDNYGQFEDSYNSRVIYSVDLRSGCRAYYTPIFGNKTKIQ